MKQGFLDKSSKKGKKKSSKQSSNPTPSSTSPGSTSQWNPSSSLSRPNTSTPNSQNPLGEQLLETLRRTRSGTHDSRGQACTALGALASKIVDLDQHQSILENLDLDICNEIFLPMRQAPIRRALNGRSDPESITDDIFFSSMSIGFIMTLFNQFFQQGGSLDNKTTFINMMDILFRMVAKGGVVKRLSPWGENYANLPRAHVVGFGDAKCTAEALFLLNKMLGDDDGVSEISKERTLLLKKVAREGYLNDLAEGIQRLTATVRGGKLQFMEEEEGEEEEVSSLFEFNALEKAVQLGDCLVSDLEKVLGQTIDVEYPKQAMKMIDAASDAFGLIVDVHQIGQMMIVRRGSPIPIMQESGSFDAVMRLCGDIQWHVQPLLLQLFNSEFSPEMAAMLRKRKKWTKYLRNGAGMMFRSKFLPIYKRRSLCVVLKMMFDLHKERGLLGDPGVNGGPPTGMDFFKILVEITRIEIGISLKDALAPPGTMVESAEHESKKITALERAYGCSGVYYTILDDCIDALAVCATDDNEDDDANKDAEYRLPLDVALRAMATIHDSIVAMLDFIETALFDPAFTNSQPMPTSSNNSSTTFNTAPSWMDDTFKRSLILTGAVKVVGHYAFENPEPLAHRIVPLLPLLLSMKCVEEWRTELNCSLLHRKTAMRTGWTELPEGVKYFQDTLYGIAGAIEPYCWDEYTTRVFHEDEEEEGSGKRRRRRRKGGNGNNNEEEEEEEEEEDSPDFLEIECSEEVRDVWMKGMLVPAAFSCIIDSLATLGRVSRGRYLFRSMAALVYRLVSYPEFDIVAGDAEGKEKEGVSCSTNKSLIPQLLLALKAVKPLLECATKYRMAEMAEATVEFLVHNNMEAIDGISNGMYYLRFGFAASLILKKSFLQLDDDNGAANDEKEDEEAKTAVIYERTGVTVEFIAEKLLLLMEAFCEKLLSLFYIRFTRGSFFPVEVQLASAVRVDVARCAEHCLEIAKRDRRFLGACAENNWLIEDVARFRGANRQTREKGYPDELIEFALFCKKEGSQG